MKKLPVGIQSFKEIRKKGYVYVDKTEYIYRLTQDKYYFLSRPRRFGKSLLVNTIAELFAGNKELFEGLWVEDKWDWAVKSPVIQIGFSSIGYKTIGLEEALLRTITQQAEAVGCSLQSKGYDACFKELISYLAVKHGPVVVLIDEYDKPIIDYLEDSDKAKSQRDILKAFYSVLKDLDDHLRMVFITGVSKFSRTSIFSDLNNLTDLSGMNLYSTMMGYTQEELESYFEVEINALAKQSGKSRKESLEEIRDWYNGYSWDGVNKVYNPYSVLSLFFGMQFRNFWFSTGTPTFLVKLLDRRRQYALEGIRVTEAVFESFDLDNISSETLLFQTGYVTVKGPPKMGLWTLGYPNREVRESMLRHLVAGMAHKTPAAAAAPALMMAEALEEADFDALEEHINALLAGIPYEWHDKAESYYHTLMHLAFSLIGVYIQSEIHVAKGRLDSVIHASNAVYVLEFKVDKSPEAALEQIKEKGYAAPYLTQGKSVWAVGINFSSSKKEVAGLLREEL